MYDNYGNLYLLIEIDEKYADNDFRIKEADGITKTIAEYDELIFNKNFTRYGIEKKVHDKLITDNRYAYDENGQPESEKFAHSIAGSLNKESYSGGVCELYAKAMQLLMNRYGVPCRYVAGLAADSSGNAEGNAWGVGRYSSTGADATYEYFAYPTSNGAVLSIVTSEDYMFSFDYNISSNDSYYEVYIDDKLAATLGYTGDYYSTYSLTTGSGMHKISFKFKDDDNANFGTVETIYNFNFVKCGDVNFDNTVNIIDAVNILSIDEPNYNLIAIYDYNKDNILDNKDAAAVLRKASGI